MGTKNSKKRVIPIEEKRAWSDDHYLYMIPPLLNIKELLHLNTQYTRIIYQLLKISNMC